MTIAQLKNIILEYDSEARKMRGDGTKESYTVWTPHTQSDTWADDGIEDSSAIVTIDRFTKNLDDDLIYQLYQALAIAGANLEEPILDKSEMLETGYLHFILNVYVTERIK